MLPFKASVHPPSLHLSLSLSLPTSIPSRVCLLTPFYLPLYHYRPISPRAETCSEQRSVRSNLKISLFQMFQLCSLSCFLSLLLIVPPITPFPIPSLSPSRSPRSSTYSSIVLPIHPCHCFLSYSCVLILSLAPTPPPPSCSCSLPKFRPLKLQTG